LGALAALQKDILLVGNIAPGFSQCDGAHPVASRKARIEKERNTLPRLGEVEMCSPLLLVSGVTGFLLS
jgi:hypothetical protein